MVARGSEMGFGKVGRRRRLDIGMDSDEVDGKGGGDAMS